MPPCTLLLLAASPLPGPCPDAQGPLYGGTFEEAHEWRGAARFDAFGSTLALLGDLDGDGVPDLAVGSPLADPGAIPNAGRLILASGRDRSTLLELRGTAAKEELGAAVAPAGDLDGDGRADLAVGASGAAGAGAVRLYSGATGAVLRVLPPPAGARAFGSALASLGDVDGDGTPDLAAGDPEADRGGRRSCGVVLLYSGATGAVLWSMDGAADMDFLGNALAAAGDVDGDGIQDLLAGARGTDARGLEDSGAVHLLSGATGRILRTWTGWARALRLGEVLAGPGDMDGDGVPDVALGAPWDDLGRPVGSGSNRGRVRVWSGATGALLWERKGQGDGEQFGAALAGLGDVDRDGLADLAVGADGPAHGGAVTVWSGRGELRYRLESRGWHQAFGAALAGLGDLDGDGAPEFLAAAPESLVDPVGSAGAAWLLEWKPGLTASTDWISAAAGGTVVLDLDFRSQWYSREDRVWYHVLLSASGTGPTTLAGLPVPLTPDALYAATLAGQDPPLLGGSGGGRLDLFGDGQAVFTFAPGALAGLVGRTFHAAAIQYEEDPPGRFRLHAVSVAEPLAVLP